MTNYHEPANELSDETRDFSRALISFREELEAIDWYNQRKDVTKDPVLAEILDHNMKEEMEHACMIMEWLRRNMPYWDEQMKEYLFKEGEIIHHEEPGDDSSKDLGIGKIS